LFRLLVKRGPEGYTPSQLSEKLDVPGPTLSFHLKELQRANLIEARREGRFLYYSPNFSHMNRVLGFLTENCCVLGNQDCGPACEVPAAEVGQPKRRQA
jgi:DNA-binding transcriptional ArsR family regulator